MRTKEKTINITLQKNCQIITNKCLQLIANQSIEKQNKTKREFHNSKMKLRRHQKTTVRFARVAHKTSASETIMNYALR